MATRTTRLTRAIHTALMAGMTMAASLPAPVHSQALPIGCQLGPTYTGTAGIQSINNPIAPPIINIPKDAPVGTIVYQGTLPPIPFTCYSGSALSLKYGPALSADGNFISNLMPLLNEAGLGIRLTFPGFAPWVPSDPRVDTSGYQIWPNYATPHSPTSGVLNGTLEIFVAKTITKPLQMQIPTTPGLFSLIHGPGRPTANRILIGTSNLTWVYVLPQRCLVKLSVPSVVNLGFAYAAHDFPMPSPRPFNINIALNPDCEGFGDPSKWGVFVLPLEIMFSVPGAASDTELPLYNEAGDPNGLDLVIKQSHVIPVHFNKWESTESLTSAIPAKSLEFSASLARHGTAPIKTGKFSQQVIVQVRYM